KLCGSGNAEGEAEGGGGGRLLLNGWKLLGLHREMRPAILAPAILAGIVADRALLAVADHRDPVRPDASRDQIVHRSLRAALAERQVVVWRPALVGVALDEDLPTRVGLHEIGVLVEHLRVFGSNLVRIELEADVTQVRLRGEVFRVGSGRAVRACGRSGRGPGNTSAIRRSTHRSAGG